MQPKRYPGRLLAALFMVSLLAGADRNQALAQASATQGPTMRFIQTNGIRMRIAEAGKGPLVILVHGWPESWYSWRRQIPVLEQAGYHVVAPDMRGYGKTDKPTAVEDYDLQHLVAD